MFLIFMLKIPQILMKNIKELRIRKIINEFKKNGLDKKKFYKQLKI